MTKAELIRSVSQKTGMGKEEIGTVVEAVMDTIKDSLSGGEEVYFRGFGSFIIKQRAAKPARNIAKNTTVLIPAHKIPSFKPSKEFVAMLQNL